MTPTAARLAAVNVLVAGDAMLDRYWFGQVDRISPEAPVPVVRVTRDEERLGGAANVALNLRTLGARVTLLTAVGDDEAATRLDALLAREGVQRMLQRDPALQTIVKLRVIGRSQQLIRLDFESTPARQVLADLLTGFQRALSAHDAVLFSDYGKGGLSDVAQMIGAARQAGKPVLVDPKGSDFSRYAGATAITPNLSELQRVVGSWDSEQALADRAQALREQLRLDAVVLTRSEDGMSVFDADGHFHVAAQAREVFDVTGAGDTVIATLTALVATGMTIRDAMPVANRAGGLVVAKFGTAGVAWSELFESA